MVKVHHDRFLKPHSPSHHHLHHHLHTRHHHQCTSLRTRNSVCIQLACLRHAVSGVQRKTESAKNVEGTEAGKGNNLTGIPCCFFHFSLALFRAAYQLSERLEQVSIQLSSSLRLIRKYFYATGPWILDWVVQVQGVAGARVQLLGKTLYFHSASGYWQYVPSREGGGGGEGKNT